MRLKAVVPTLPETLLAALEACDVRTDTDLLFSGTPLQIYERLPQGTVTLADLKRHIQNTASHVSTPGMRADELLQQERARHDAPGSGRLSCGAPELDKLTEGYDGPKVVEISGDHGSGKTVSLAIMIHQFFLQNTRPVVSSANSGATTCYRG